MRTIAVAKFKAQCLSLIEHLGPDGIIITKHGRPVARLIPIERSSADLIGSMKDRIRINGDILTTDAHWDSCAQP